MEARLQAVAEKRERAEAAQHSKPGRREMDDLLARARESAKLGLDSIVPSKEEMRGAKLAAEEAAAEKAAAERKPEQVAAAVVPAVCAGCGNYLMAHAQLCGTCGAAGPGDSGVKTPKRDIETARTAPGRALWALWTGASSQREDQASVPANEWREMLAQNLALLDKHFAGTALQALLRIEVGSSLLTWAEVAAAARVTDPAQHQAVWQQHLLQKDSI